MSVDRLEGGIATDIDDPGGPDPRDESAGVERFVATSALALAGAAAIGIAFSALALLVRARWAPLQTADQVVADKLVAVVADNELLRKVLTGISTLGATVTLATMLAVAAFWLARRGQPRLAFYVLLTGVGGSILNLVVKQLVERLRPVVETPVSSAGGWSFPSGHSMNSLVGYGVVALVFVPLLRTGARRAVTAAVVVLVVVIGLTRIALGVHYLTDVLAGWLLGALWLGLTTVAFYRWRRDSGTGDTGPLPGDVSADTEDDLRPVPVQHPPLMSHPWRGVGELAVAWVLLVGLLIGLGMAVKFLESDTTVLDWDLRVVTVFAEHRTSTWTGLLNVFSEVGNTVAIIAVALVVAVLAVAVFRSWRPVLFLGVALLGEITLFLTTAAIVDRDRPRVVHLNPDLPPTASFPSGHVAASVTLYAGIAALVWARTNRWQYRLLAAAALLIPVLVAVQRLYAGAHHPTDIMGAVLLAAVWTAIVWWVVEPVGASDRSVRAQ